MNELQIFQNDEFGKVRTLLIENEPWFVGKDVAKSLEYKRTADAIKIHVDDEDKRLVKVGEIPTLSVTSPYGVYIINESGLYSLILSSKLPSAKKFKRWVTSEVLPALRKTGSYTIAPEQTQQRQITSDDYIRAASIISTCKNERLPYVFDLLKKGGIKISLIPNAVPGSCQSQNRDTTGRAANAINAAILVYGLKPADISRMTGISRTQITRIRRGESRPYISRAKFICETIHKAIPEIPAYEEEN